MKIQVGIFFGGKSVEHEVSVISAAQAAAALDPGKYEAVAIYITKDNEMYTGPELLIPSHFRDLPSLLARSRRVVLCRDKGKVGLITYPARLFSRAPVVYLDVAFPVIHGTNGEDGSLQGFLQMHGLPYVGSDVGASAAGMDKWTTKCLLQSEGLPVLPGVCFRGAAYESDPVSIIQKLEAFHAWPLIVKPVNLGSSVGISAAHDREELSGSIEFALSFSERVLVEPMLVPMREINCAVLGDADHNEASVCEEPLAAGEILSYLDKYQGGGKSKGAGRSAAGDTGGADSVSGTGGAGLTGGLKVSVAGATGAKGMGSSLRKLPAELEPAREAEIRSLAQQVFTALQCSGVARVDFLFDPDDEKVYINEINTIPGSLSFYLWEAAGKSFRQLTDELIILALRRERTRQRLIWSNDVNILSGLTAGLKGNKSR